VEVDDVEQVVRGTIPVSWLAGSPIALVGKNYQVTIAPLQDTSTPIQDKPEFTTFTNRVSR
jgi:hypothetical protein